MKKTTWECVKCGRQNPEGKALVGLVEAPAIDPSRIRRGICRPCFDAFEKRGETLDPRDYGGPVAWVPGDPMDDLLVEHGNDPAFAGIEVLGSRGTEEGNRILIPVTLKAAIQVRDWFLEGGDARLGAARDAMFDSLQRWRKRIGDIEVWVNLDHSDYRMTVHAAPFGDWTDRIQVERSESRRSLGEDGECWTTKIGYGSSGSMSVERASLIAECFEAILAVAAYMESNAYKHDYDSLLTWILENDL